jgi:hypothetical protein
MAELQTTGGTKFDGGKIPTELLSTEALLAVLSGQRKDYDEDSERFVDVDAALEELVVWYRGYDDADFRLPSAAEFLLGAISNELGADNINAGWLEVAKVLDFGQKKYAAWNWEQGLTYTRVYAAALRHIFQHMNGEKRDAETGLLHLAHALCEVMFLLAYTVQDRTELDDRRKPYVKPQKPTTILPPPSVESSKPVAIPPLPSIKDAPKVGSFPVYDIDFSATPAGT